MIRKMPDRDEIRSGAMLRDLVSDRQKGSGGHSSLPRSAYEEVTRQMVKSLTGEVRDVKHRVNQLFTLIIGAILLEVLMRLIGVGM